MTPAVMIAKPPGVLPISAVQAQPNGSNVKTTATQAKSKVVIRRLPPGMTQLELQDALGVEWAVGKGKVDWMLFRPGKVSKDLAKPSRPARVYLQVTNQAYLDSLVEKVRNTTFSDARNTAGDTVLIGLPVVEFAPYGRVPANKKRHDARQGLIDQDPEFIQFLESLTNPISKAVATEVNQESWDRKDANITVTPLIQHLREKKAAKEAAKEKSSTAKSAKHTRKGSKNENVEVKGEAELLPPVSKESGKAVEKEKRPGRTAKAERTPKIAARPVKVETAAVETKPQNTPRGSPQATKVLPVATKTVPEYTAKKSDAVDPGAAAARMLQRDLGIRGGRGAGIRRGGARQGAEQSRGASNASNIPAQAPSGPPGDKATVVAPVPAKTSAKPTPVVSNTTESSAQPLAANKPPSAPAIMKRNAQNKAAQNLAAKANVRPAAASVQSSTSTTSITNNTPTTVNTPTPHSTVQSPNPAPTPPSTQAKPILSLPTSTKAFLKHANPSQGITEPLLMEALSAFGPITTVEIDKRKGFAYVEFAEPEGLKKAIAASPVKVAQGSVQVLERKDRVSAGPAAGRGGPPVPNVAGSVGTPGAGTGPASGAAAGTGAGRGAPAARGGGATSGRGGQGTTGQAPQQPVQPQQPQSFRGGRAGAARGRGGAGRGGTAANAVLAPAASTTSTSNTAASEAQKPALETPFAPAPAAKVVLPGPGDSVHAGSDGVSGMRVAASAETTAATVSAASSAEEKTA